MRAVQALSVWILCQIWLCALPSWTQPSKQVLVAGWTPGFGGGGLFCSLRQAATPAIAVSVQATTHGWLGCIWLSRLWIHCSFIRGWGGVGEMLQSAPWRHALTLKHGSRLSPMFEFLASNSAFCLWLGVWEHDRRLWATDASNIFGTEVLPFELPDPFVDTACMFANLFSRSERVGTLK